MSFFESVSSIVKNFTDFYSEINSANLTGAIDVIVVEQEDGSLKGTPFHVKFGKLGVLKAREKIVDIEVNGEPVDLHMKLDDNGTAFFIEDLSDNEDEEYIERPDLITSPLPTSSMSWENKRVQSGLQPKKLVFPTKENNVSEINILLENDSHVSKTNFGHHTNNGILNKKKRRKRSKLRLKLSGNNSSSLLDLSETEDGNDMFAMEDINDAVKENRLSESSVDTYKSEEAQDEEQSSHIYYEHLLLSEYDLVANTGEDYSIPERTSHSAFNTDTNMNLVECDPLKTVEAVPRDTTTWRWGELPYQTARTDMSMENVFAPNEEKQCREMGCGVPSDDIHNVPENLNELCHLSEDFNKTQIANTPETQAVDCESGNGSSLPMSPISNMSQSLKSETITSDLETEGPSGEVQDTEVQQNVPSLAFSYCGGLVNETITPSRFESGALTYDSLVDRLRSGDRDIFGDPRLVVRVHEKYLPWEKAAPILLPEVLFHMPLPQDISEGILKEGIDVNLSLSGNNIDYEAHNERKSSWFDWFGRSKSKDQQRYHTENEENKENKNHEENLIEDENIETETQDAVLPNATYRNRQETENSSSDTDGTLRKKKFRKTLRLTSKQLASLNLKPGNNEIQLSVTTAFQGTTLCKCHVFKWHHSDKVVISDIDGTITKSDVFGHLLPLIGKDWAQAGVAQLFSKIKNNGYHIMYLTARAIGQSSVTKDYLKSLKQDNACLPSGPVFLNPDSLFNAVRREVIDKNPEEFKIQCLQDIQSLFNGKQPFFAGYGNRPNDTFAYKQVGISESRIFTINPAGELNLALTPIQNFQTSYPEQNIMVDMVFPFSFNQVGCLHPERDLQQFSSFPFWRNFPKEISDDQICV